MYATQSRGKIRFSEVNMAPNDCLNCDISAITTFLQKLLLLAP